MRVEARDCYYTARLAGSHRRALDVGLDFIWDLPMTLLLNLSNIYRHRRRAFRMLNSIQLGYVLWLDFALRRAALRAAASQMPND